MRSTCGAIRNWWHCHFPPFWFSLVGRFTRIIPNRVLSLGLFKILGILDKTTKWAWHENRYQTRNSGLSSCLDSLLPTIFRMRYVIVCECKCLENFIIRLKWYVSVTYVDPFGLLVCAMSLFPVSKKHFFNSIYGFSQGRSIWHEKKKNWALLFENFRNFVTLHRHPSVRWEVGSTDF